MPYFGSPLYGIAQKEGLIADTVLGRDYFNTPTIGTKYLGIDEIEAFRRKTILRYHVRPIYIIRKLIQSGGSPKIVANYFRFGIRLLKNNLSKIFSHKTSV